MEGGKPTSRWPPILYRFNDPSTADVVLSITGNPAVEIYVHSSIVRSRAGYFAALLSDRWRQQPSDVVVSSQRLNFTISLTSGSIDTYISVLRLLYVDDICREIDGASCAIEILPVAQELLFEDCVSACVRFLEAVPWTDEEELRVVDLIPHLNAEESRELLCRASLLPDSGEEAVDELLSVIVFGALDHQPKGLHQDKSDKLWVAKVLRDFSTRESAGRALDRAFGTTFFLFEGKLSWFPQVIGRDLLWLVETMLQLRVADNAMKRWSKLPFSDMEASLSLEFQQISGLGKALQLKPFSDTLLKCTHRFANAVAADAVLAPRQIRIKLVEDWVRLLIVCKEHFSIMLPSDKTVCLELEETILKIMSTLPMLEAKESPQHCLGS